jgi:dTDP-4-amino-4,6-dideoxygalactose transaminase
MKADRIPMLDLAAQHAEIKKELLESFAEVIASGRFILGERVKSFEADLAKCCDASHGISCNSGTDALWLALRALDIGPGDAVICPAHSFFATAAAIVRVGATPVFADIDPATLNLDPADVLQRAEATPNLKAVLTVDLFGRICELDALTDYCDTRGITTIEDAAQSIGAVDTLGRAVGKRADVACFSFYPTKNLGALGDAGGIVTSNRALAERIARLRAHGESEPGVYEEVGINSRLDALQASALSIKLRYLERWTRARRELAMHYDALFIARGAVPASVPMSEASLSLQFPTPVLEPGRHTFHRYVIRVPASRRAGLIAALTAQDIATEIYYPRGLHQQPALAEFAPGKNEAPLVETERATHETLALPLYPELGLDQVEQIVDLAAQFLQAE